MIVEFRKYCLAKLLCNTIVLSSDCWGPSRQHMWQRPVAGFLVHFVVSLEEHCCPAVSTILLVSTLHLHTLGGQTNLAKRSTTINTRSLLNTDLSHHHPPPSTIPAVLPSSTVQPPPSYNQPFTNTPKPADSHIKGNAPKDYKHAFPSPRLPPPTPP